MTAAPDNNVQVVGQDEPRLPFRDASFRLAQLEAAGLQTEDSDVGAETVTFADVGALAWYLRMIPWTVPGFSIEENREQLRELHRRIHDDGALVFNMPGFYLVAMRPGAGSR